MEFGCPAGAITPSILGGKQGLVGLAVELAPILFVMEHAGAEPQAGGHLQPRWIGCGAQALEQDFAVRRRVREAELRAANAQLAAAIQARHEYSPEVAAAVERFHAAMGALQSETVEHVLAMRKVMTPEQAAKFDRRVSEALTNDSL